MKTMEFEARKAYSESVTYLPVDQCGLVVNACVKGLIPNGELYEVSIKNEAKEAFTGVVHAKIVVDLADCPKDSLGFFMPGYMYGTNTADMPNHGRKEFPRIAMGNTTRPESNYWMTRSDRLAEPVSIVYCNGHVYGISAFPYWRGEDGAFQKFNGFTCQVEKAGSYASVGFTLGYENAPWLFIQSATVLEREPLTENNSISIASGEEISFELRVYDYAAEAEVGVHEAIKHVYEVFHQSPRKIEGMTVQKATKLLSEAVRDAAWLTEEHMYTGFVYDTEGGNTSNKIGSLTWTNGLSAACPMLLAANRLQDDTLRNQALTFIGEVLGHSYNPASGFMYEAVENGHWSTRGWWYSGMHSGGHSSYLNGQAIYYILKSYLSEKQFRGIDHKDWLDFVAPMLEKLNRIKNTDAEYPFAMSEKTGAGIEYDSLGGAWCLAATALFAQITGESLELEGMRASEQHYYDAFVKKVVCYGGPLDTDKAVDDEGILAYIRATRLLHELTGEAKFLDHLRDALYYEVSFKLGYNTPVQVPPLSTIGWSSCGGSITSVANPHIHPMSSTVIDEMIYYLRYAQDSYIASRLEDTILWGLQTFNSYEKEYDYGRIGWMSERFCFCQGLMTEKYPDGSPASTWFALMPWAVGSIVEGFVGDCWDGGL